MTDADVGNALKKVREQRGKSQREIARSVGLPKDAVCKFELGQRRVTALELIRLLRIYRISYEHFLTHLRTN